MKTLASVTAGILKILLVIASAMTALSALSVLGFFPPVSRLVSPETSMRFWFGVTVLIAMCAFYGWWGVAAAAFLVSSVAFAMAQVHGETILGFSLQSVDIAGTAIVSLAIGMIVAALKILIAHHRHAGSGAS